MAEAAAAWPAFLLAVSSSGAATTTTTVTGATREGTGITTPENNLCSTGLAIAGVGSNISIVPTLGTASPGRVEQKTHHRQS